MSDERSAASPGTVYGRRNRHTEVIEVRNGPTLDDPFLKINESQLTQEGFAQALSNTNPSLLEGRIRNHFHSDPGSVRSSSPSMHPGNHASSLFMSRNPSAYSDSFERAFDPQGFGVTNGSLNTTEPSTVGDKEGGQLSPFRMGDWVCATATCSYHNFATRTTCLGCNAPKPFSGAGAQTASSPLGATWPPDLLSGHVTNQQWRRSFMTGSMDLMSRNTGGLAQPPTSLYQGPSLAGLSTYTDQGTRQASLGKEMTGSQQQRTRLVASNSYDMTSSGHTRDPARQPSASTLFTSLNVSGNADSKHFRTSASPALNPPTPLTANSAPLNTVVEALTTKGSKGTVNDPATLAAAVKLNQWGIG